MTNNYFSLELSKLYKQISYIIINTGNIKKFDIAKDYLEKAINNVNGAINEALKTIEQNRSELK